VTREDAPPGSVLLHPALLVSLVVLVLNDHVLKRVCPGVITGKLSDFAVVIVLPLFLHGVVELVLARALGRSLSSRAADRWLLGSLLVSLLVFALPEFWQPAEDAYRFGLAYGQRPFRALWARLSGRELGPLRPVRATADLTDLFAMPFAAIAYWAARRSPKRMTKHAATGAALLACALGSPQAALAASAPRTHDGFYMSLDIGVGAALVDSSGSLNNGARQPIESTARGFGPTGALSLGGTPRGTRLVFGGRFGFWSAPNPVLHLLDRSFRLEDHYLKGAEASAFGLYYPNPRSGLHFGGSLGIAGFGTSREAMAPGFLLGLELGHGFFFTSQLSVAATCRLSVSHTYGLAEGVTSTALLPALLLGVTLH
jgi:hypothetical protein